MRSVFMKRVVDLVLTVLSLIVLAPLILAIAIVIRVKLGRPVLFRQERPGLRDRPFTMLKFRTMSEARDAQGELLPDHCRLTRLGRFLRSTSLDELPELFNVLAGDMSLVGPRPLLMQYLPRYTLEQRRRNEVKPGITGWAQVNGRNALSWADRFAMDAWYVDHWSVWLDLKILARTVWTVLRRDGIDFPADLTTTEFMGSADPPSVVSSRPESNEPTSGLRSADLTKG